MQMQDLKDLYVLKLQEIYSAEQQGLEAMRLAAQTAATPELQQGLTMHIDQTQQQIQRLEQLFQKLGAQPSGQTNLAMQGLIQEAQRLMRQDASPEVLEAGLIACQQAMEHHEIACYGTARTYAQLLGEDEAAQVLEQTLGEEKRTDDLLTQIAGQINVAAMNA
ncbi:ferritin-like domain-containing protein [Deinococcus deserti]